METDEAREAGVPIPASAMAGAGAGAAAAAAAAGGSVASGSRAAELHQLPIRAYLDQTVVPILLMGMSQLVKDRCVAAPPFPARRLRAHPMPRPPAGAPAAALAAAPAAEGTADAVVASRAAALAKRAGSGHWRPPPPLASVSSSGCCGWCPPLGSGR